MSKGWVKLHRSLFDNDLWTAEPFTKGQAWIDLFANANHSPQSFWVREVEVRVDRGQLAWSEVTMAKRWQWSRGKVRRYLGMLKTRQMIEQQSDNVTSIITICNYRDFQDTGTAGNTADGTADGTPSSTADGQQTVHKQEGLELKNEKNVKDKPLSHSDKPNTDDVEQAFEAFWSAGMRKVGSKKDTLTKFKRLAGKDPHGFAQMLITDVKRRLASGQMGFDQLHPKTYLNGERWNDEYVSNLPATAGSQDNTDYYRDKAKQDPFL